MKEKFINGYGYVFFGSESIEEYGQIITARGFWGRKTPNGNPGASFKPDFLGKTKSEFQVNQPWIYDSYYNK